MHLSKFFFSCWLIRGFFFVVFLLFDFAISNVANSDQFDLLFSLNGNGEYFEELKNFGGGEALNAIQ